MKHILSLLLAVAFMLCACTSPEEPESGEPQEPVESVENSDLPEDVEKTEESAEMQEDEEPVEDGEGEDPLEEESTENVEIQEEEEEEDKPELPELTAADIGMTDEEIYTLAMKRADELKELFLDYLQYDESKTVFSFDFDNYLLGKATDNDKVELAFYPVIHDTIKTYDDLFKIFNKICTSEYSTQLLTKTSIYYTDVEGQLCMRETIRVRGPIQSINGSEYLSYDIIDYNMIRLNFTVDMFFMGSTDFDGRTDNYFILLKNINGEWLISNANESLHGYEWNISD